MAPTLIPGRLNAAYTRVAAANILGFNIFNHFYIFNQHFTEFCTVKLYPIPHYAYTNFSVYPLLYFVFIACCSACIEDW